MKAMDQKQVAGAVPPEAEGISLDAESAARSAQAQLFAKALRAASDARDHGTPVKVRSFLEEFSLGIADVVGSGPSVTFSRDKDSLVREFRFVSAAALDGADPKMTWNPSVVSDSETSASELVRSAVDVLARQAAMTPPRPEVRPGRRETILPS
jgi:hypothetical protein